ncbi:DUF1499 domain-containing protein [Pseudomonas oryzagri]|uniref:DUF1499 domain-containing protein n=1 Tax=Pseudomonas sp. GCM10022188 TaxID=3252651 RepID=UPI0022285B91
MGLHPSGKVRFIKCRRALHKALLCCLPLGLAACSGPTPTHLGVHDGRLAPCPDSPNCVCSQASDARHAIAPLPLAGSPEASRVRLLEILASEPRVRVVEQQERYLRAEFTSFVFRFVDDVEFLIGERQIDVRSASRLGHSDFGVNRKRIEHLRRRMSAGAR